MSPIIESIPDLSADAYREPEAEHDEAHRAVSFHEGRAEPVWAFTNGLRFVYEDYKGTQRFYVLEVDGETFSNPDAPEGERRYLGFVDEDRRSERFDGVVNLYGYIVDSPVHRAPESLGYPSVTLEPDVDVEVPTEDLAEGMQHVAIALRAMLDAQRKYREHIRPEYFRRPLITPPHAQFDRGGVVACGEGA